MRNGSPWWRAWNAAARSVRLGVADTEHYLAVLAGRRHALERGAGVGEREDGVELRPQLAGVDERGQLEELFAVRLDDEVGRARRLLGDRDEARPRGAGE